MNKGLLIYDTFNAKYLSYRAIAESFVLNDEYRQLQGNNNVLLMGPRGCGKTTLLKMLTPAGLYYLKSRDNNLKIDNIGFTSIYIPSDIQWKNQLDFLNVRLKESNKNCELIAQYLFAVNIQIAICKTFLSIIDFGEHGSQEKLNIEYEVAEGLIREWKINEVNVPVIDQIELGLLRRLSNVNSIINESYFSDSKDPLISLLPKYVYTEFYDLVRVACKVFESVLGLDKEHKWSLCFDELEIAPKFLQIKLMNYLRSVDQKFLFKITTTPLFNLEDYVVDASQGNDFGTVRLWVYDTNGKKKWEQFGRELILNRIKVFSSDSEGIQLEEVFGKYILDDIIKSELDELSFEIRNKKLNYKGKFNQGTGMGSSVYYMFKYLTMVDSSFKDFLSRRGVDPDDPVAYDYMTSKRIFLKYKVDAVYRLVYRKRGRRNPPIHYGIPYLIEVCDGNPRLLIGLVEEILSNIKSNNISIKIPKNIQSNVLVRESIRHYNLIENYPDSTIVVDDKEFNLANDLIDAIASYMHGKIVQGDFSKISPSTFRVDDGINHKMIKLLEIGLALGAIIYLDPIEALSSKGVVGKRFKLSGFLAPMFKVPNRTLYEVNLSSILNTKIKTADSGGGKQLKIPLSDDWD